MVIALKIVGIIFIVISPFSIVFGVPPSLTTLAFGLLLLGVSEILFSVRNIESKVIASTVNKEYIVRLIDRSKRYPFKSESLKVYTEDSEIFPVIVLENEVYIPLAVLTNYVEPNENEYIFTLPNSEELRLKVYSSYQPKADLFEVDSQLFVKASALGLSLSIENDSVVVLCS
jgi:hypothetical protein